MSKLSPTQQRVLAAASKQPKTDVREHMKDIKSPAIRDKVIESMLKNGLIAEDPDADGVVYIISEQGFAAIGKSKPKGKAADAAPKAAKGKKPAAESKEKEPKEKKVTKQQTLIDMLQRKEGATLQQMMDATGWQKHSLHGAMAGGLKKKLGYNITSTKKDGEERVYRIA